MNSGTLGVSETKNYSSRHACFVNWSNTIIQNTLIYSCLAISLKGFCPISWCIRSILYYNSFSCRKDTKRQNVTTDTLFINMQHLKEFIKEFKSPRATRNRFASHNLGGGGL